MRKSEFKAKSEKSTIGKDKTPGLTFYKSLQYRWENSADPETDDEKYHFTKEEALEAAKAIDLNVGFSALVQTLTIEYDLFNESFEFGEEFEFSDVEKLIHMYSGNDFSEEYIDTNNGKSIVGSIVVAWSWHRYVGYSRKLEQIQYASYWNLETEQDLHTGNEDRTFHSNFSVLLTAEEIEGLTEKQIAEAIEEKLQDSSWKWNNVNTGRTYIGQLLGVDVFEEIEEAEF